VIKQTSVKLLLFFFILASASAVGQPDITCLQVDDAGNVTVNWVPPTSAQPNFSHYEVIFSISPALDFTTAANNLLPLQLNSHVHVTNVTLENNYYYAVLAWYNDGAGGSYAISSDTLSTIYLEAEAAQNICENCDSAAYLQWNEPWLPLGTDTAGLQYQIWTDYPSGNWQLLAEVGFEVNEYLNYVYNCSPIAMNFMIRLVTSDGCEFISNVDGDEFRDAVFPSTGPIMKIELDANNYGYLEWEHVATGDIVGYSIYRCSISSIGDVTTVQIGEVDQAPWNFTDVFAFANAVNTYSIAAYDLCGNADTTSCRVSSFLEVTPYAVCSSEIEMEWTPYGGWLSAPSFYIVYNGVSESDSFDSVELVPIDTVNSLQYTDAQIEHGLYNVYRIEAIDTISGYRAFSNFHNTYVNEYEVPENLEIQYASVLSSDSIEIKLSLTPTQSTFRYELQRLDESTQTWKELIVEDINVQFEIYFYDDYCATDVFSYSYRVIVYDACGMPADTTNIATTILLDGQSNQERLVNTLAWTPYGEWEGGVDRYAIYRKLKGLNYELIDEIHGGASLFYEDDVSELIQSDGDFSYRIEAIEKSDGPRQPYASRSNEVNLSVDPIIWIPNAIVVGGYNDIFKPTMSFALVEEYYLVIFSRWGDLVFETRDIEEGWDGYMKDRAVQEGVYNYYLTVKDGRGRVIDRFGSLSVLNYE
jgi:gliding motility-associated-like protein